MLLNTYFTSTGTNIQLMLKYCGKSDKITKINYKQPYYLLHWCHLSENNKKKLNKKPCYANNIAPKSFAIRVIRTVFPVDTQHRLNIHKTFRRHPGRLLNVLCKFNLRPVSMGVINLTVPSCFTKKCLL